MSTDRYMTLAGAGEATYREKASRFLAYAFPIADEEAFQSEAARLARRHHDARHHCYAWVLGADGARKRSNDAGEPQGTAGRPILRRIEAAGLTHAAVVVVRYFGGTLLGKGGLVRAYGEAARLALQAAPVVEQVVRIPLTITCDQALAGALRAAVLQADGEVVLATYDERCRFDVLLPPSIITVLRNNWSVHGALFDDQAGGK
ncbi:MAG TPA: YigZ family protein [Flavobacteriales bacterium]|nr:YigZ family protein [Flavobacteriales bacterium]HQW86405.1 YigZ family protein [Flavobacteriales bacterium]